MKTIVDRIGKPALPEQTAEECAELAHVCLKEARRLRGENPSSKHGARPTAWRSQDGSSKSTGDTM